MTYAADDVQVVVGANPEPPDRARCTVGSESRRGADDQSGAPQDLPNLPNPAIRDSPRKISTPNAFNAMILCHEDILKAHEEGRIIIDPFEPRLVGINSVDVRLGPDVYKLTGTEPRDLYSNNTARWERVEPVKAGALRHLYPHFGLEVLEDDDDCFIFRSGGFYLATTLEAIGTRADPKGVDGDGTVVPEMKARSTVGRQGLTVALCAGLGDVGYSSRWALEVRVVDYGDIVLAVGTPIAQVVFHTATATNAKYDGASRYQHEGSVRFLPKPLRVFRPE